MADYNSKHTGKAVDDAVDRTGFNLIQESSNATYKGNAAYKSRFIDVIDNAALKSDMPKAADDPIDTPKPILEWQTGSVGTSSKYARADHVHAFDGQVTKSFVVLESFQYWKIVNPANKNWIQIPKKETATPTKFARYSSNGNNSSQSYTPTDNDSVLIALEESLGLTITSDNVVYGISGEIPNIELKYHEFIFDGIIKIVYMAASTIKINVAVLQPSSPISVSVLERISGGYILLWYRYYNNYNYRVAFAVDHDGMIIGGVYTTETGSSPTIYVLNDLRDGTMWSSECYVTKYNDTAHIDTMFRGKALQKLQEGSLIPNTSIFHQYATFYPKLLSGVPLAINGNSVKVAREDHTHSEYAKATDLNVVKTDVDNLKTDVKALKENVVIDDVVVMESSGWIKIYKIKPSSSGYFEKDILVIRADGSIVIRTFGNTGTSSDMNVTVSSHNTYKTIIQKFFGIEIAQNTTYTIRVKNDCPSDLINAALNAQSNQQTGCYVNFVDSLKDYEIYNDTVLTLSVYTSSYKILISPYATYAPNYQYEKKDTASWTMSLIGINKSGGSMTVPAEDMTALSNGDIPRGVAVIMTSGSQLMTVITSDQIFRSISMSAVDNSLSTTNSIWYNVANSTGVLYVGDYADGKVTGSVLANKSLWTSELPTTTSGINRSILFKGKWGDVYGTSFNNLGRYNIHPSNVSIPMNANKDALIRCTYDKSTKKWTNKIVIDESVRAINIATSKVDEVKSLIRIPKYSTIKHVRRNDSGNIIKIDIGVNIHHLHFRVDSTEFRGQFYGSGLYSICIGTGSLVNQDTSGKGLNFITDYPNIRPLNATLILRKVISNHLYTVCLPVTSTGCDFTYSYGQCIMDTFTITGMYNAGMFDPSNHGSSDTETFRNPDYVEIYGTFVIASS